MPFFIVGLNAATRLTDTFWSYWSDSIGFNRKKFDNDYSEHRSKRGNRPRIEAIAKQIGPCLETNIYAIPTRKARQLSREDRQNPIIGYLFQAIKPDLVFVHSNGPIRFFEEETKCSDFTLEVKRACWQNHDFWLYGRPDALYKSSIEAAATYGMRLAEHRGR